MIQREYNYRENEQLIGDQALNKKGFLLRNPFQYYFINNLKTGIDNCKSNFKETKKGFVSLIRPQNIV